MAYFANRAFNLIYFHAAFRAFAAYGGETFVFVYLLKAGIAAQVVLLCIGLMFASRLAFRRLVLPLVRLVGLRRALALSILAEAATYPVLAQVTGLGPLLVAYLGLWAVSSSLYWTAYHGYVALLGDNEHRGAQVGGLEFVGMAVGIVAPGLTAILLTVFGPSIGFGVSGLSLAVAAIPVLLGPEVPVATTAAMPRDIRRQARLLLFADGLRSGSFHFTWMLALFVTLGGSLAAYGGVMSLAGLAGAVAGLAIGRFIDLGNGPVAARVGFAVLAVAAAARMVGYPVPVLAVIANTMAVVAWPIYATVFNARVYVLARQSPCPLRFHVIAEGGWDMGTCLSCLIAAALIQAGFSYHLPLALSLVGCGLGYVLVAASYRQPPVRLYHRVQSD